MSKSEKGHGALDKETVAQILYAFEQVRGGRGFTEDEALKVLDWASRVEAGELESYAEAARAAVMPPRGSQLPRGTRGERSG